MLACVNILNLRQQKLACTTTYKHIKTDDICDSLGMILQSQISHGKNIIFYFIINTVQMYWTDCEILCWVSGHSYPYWKASSYELSNTKLLTVIDINVMKQICLSNEEYLEYCPYYECAHTKYTELYMYKI